MSKMREVTRDLESILGPETSSLAMRFGLHSGPVTGKKEIYPLGLKNRSFILISPVSKHR